MGWFDQEAKGKDADEQAPRPAAASPTVHAAPPVKSRAGSTIGPKVQINGTVISDEDLEIVGRIEGTVHARAGLRVAREAHLKAVINGTDVMIDGKVDGDVNATGTVVLGSAAALAGNIKTPSLEIREGAFFRGQVTMQPAAARPAAPTASPKAPESAKSQVKPTDPPAGGKVDAAAQPTRSTGA